MSQLGQWLFEKERETITALLDKRAITTGIVASNSVTQVVLYSALTGSIEGSSIPVLGEMPTVGERVIVIPLGDGSRVAHRMGQASAPVGTGGHVQSGRAILLTTTVPVGALANTVMTADRLYFVPIYVPKTTSVVSTLFEVTATPYGAAMLGIYECSSSFLPTSLIVSSPKVTYGALGVKAGAIASTLLLGNRWYFVAVISSTAMGIRGSSIGANLPSPRGGSDANLASSWLLAFQDLAAGWVALPANATPSSGPANLYFHVGVGS